MQQKASLLSGAAFSTRLLACKPCMKQKGYHRTATCFHNGPTCRHKSNCIADEDAAVVNEIAVIAFGFSPRSMKSRQFAQAAVHALALLGTLVEEDKRCCHQLSLEAAAMIGDVITEWLIQASFERDWDAALPGLPLLFEALATCLASLLAHLPSSARARLLQPFAHTTEGGVHSPQSMLSLQSALVDMRTRTGHSRLLHMGLQCLFNEPLLVMAPTARAAWLVSISGITDMQQLHCLLACQLARHSRQKQRGVTPQTKGPLIQGLVDEAVEWPSKQQFLRMSNLKGSSDSPPGDGPKAAPCENQFDLLQASAWGDGDCLEYFEACTRNTGPGRLLPPDSYAMHVASSTGVPADLCCVQGMRVVLLAPRTEVITWAPQSSFPQLQARCAMQTELEPQDRAEWQQLCAGHEWA